MVKKKSSTKKSSIKPAKPIELELDKPETVKPQMAGPQPINIVNVVKQAMVQIKYEEVGSWLASHRTPLFYAHKDGFSVVDQKFIDKHPKLKKELDNMVNEIQKKPKKTTKSVQKKSVDAEYIS